MVIIVGVFFYVQFEGNSEGGRPILRCELPTDRPIMSAPAVNSSNISSSSEARSYAIQYFPQFADVDFREEDSRTYMGIIGDEMIIIHSNGVIKYSHMRDDNIVSINDFPLETGSAISLSFINDHGGLGQYEEYHRSSIEVSGGVPSGSIKGHNYVYHKQFNGYTIFGADALRTTVIAEGHAVLSYYRGDFSFDEPHLTQQTISAETAWVVVVGNYTHMGDIDITSVDLCYYISYFEENITVMYPWWRFSGPEIDFYVNAFTGEFLGRGTIK
jgi:hypothetical protein